MRTANTPQLTPPTSPPPVRGDYYDGDASEYLKLKALAHDLESRRAPSSWDPRVALAGNIWIWRADSGVTVDGSAVQSWAPWYPSNQGAATPVGQSAPQYAADVFGRGARDFPAIEDQDSWCMRSYQCTVTGAELALGADARHTVVFWVKPEAVPASGDMPICAYWDDSYSDHGRRYWLGIHNGAFVYKISADGEDGVGHAVSVTSGVTPSTEHWSRVVAVYDGAHIKLGVSYIDVDGHGTSLSWVSEDFTAGRGCSRSDDWRQRSVSPRAVLYVGA